MYKISISASNAIYQALRTYVGAGPGEPLPAYTWPGGYPIIYIDSDGAHLCPDCINRDLSDNIFPPPISAYVHYEGSPVWCDECSRAIPSAYGMPDNNEEN